MSTMEDAAAFEVLKELTTPRPISEYHEDMGPVLWWKLEWAREYDRHGSEHKVRRWAGEPPYVGSPNDVGLEVAVELRSTVMTFAGADSVETKVHRANVGGWPGYHTHFTSLPPMPMVPA